MVLLQNMKTTVQKSEYQNHDKTTIFKTINRCDEFWQINISLHVLIMNHNKRFNRRNRYRKFPMKRWLNISAKSFTLMSACAGRAGWNELKLVAAVHISGFLSTSVSYRLAACWLTGIHGYVFVAFIEDNTTMSSIRYLKSMYRIVCKTEGSRSY